MFICVGSGKCAAVDVCEGAWDHLKRRLRELDLIDVEAGVLRSKVGCLRVCRDGPIAVVYPEAVWYREASGQNLDRIIEEHLRDGRPVEPLVFARGGVPD